MAGSFGGFPPGRARMTPVPSQFFSELLTQIDDLAELKLTLFCFWALYQKSGPFRHLRRRDFITSPELMQALQTAAPQAAVESTLERALAAALARGTLLAAEVVLDSGPEQLYFVNSERGRLAVERIRSGAWQPQDDDVEILPERPNIYALYEANIGPLVPLIAEELKDAESEFPEGWIQEAIQLAVENNIRRWNYISAILKRWKKEGRQPSPREVDRLKDGKWYATGKYSDFFES